MKKYFILSVVIGVFFFCFDSCFSMNSFPAMEGDTLEYMEPRQKAIPLSSDDFQHLREGYDNFSKVSFRYFFSRLSFEQGGSLEALEALARNGFKDIVERYLWELFRIVAEKGEMRVVRYLLGRYETPRCAYGIHGNGDFHNESWKYSADVMKRDDRIFECSDLSREVGFFDDLFFYFLYRFAKHKKIIGRDKKVDHKLKDFRNFVRNAAIRRRISGYARRKALVYAIEMNSLCVVRLLLTSGLHYSKRELTTLFNMVRENITVYLTCLKTYQSRRNKSYFSEMCEILECLKMRCSKI